MATGAKEWRLCVSGEAMKVAPSREQPPSSARVGAFAAPVAAAAAAATAVWVEAQARQAERDNPPAGRFMYVDGVRLHYLVRGEGPPVVLLHGNTVALADYEASGLIDRLARNHRVVAFDRPGFGYSTRPRDRLWTPSAQAAVLRRGMALLGIGQATVVGHSMGTLVALALALDYPATVSSLVLVAGYYYPTLRLDALLTAPVALPVLGDAMRYTVSALSGRAMLNRLVQRMFAPADVPPDFFFALAREMMLRPVQIRANAEDAAFMMPAARSISRRYGELRLPVTIVAGSHDKVVDVKAHSERLHRQIPQSHLVIAPRTGHMAHYAAQDPIVAAVARSLPAASGELTTDETGSETRLDRAGTRIE
jgi:pimeloyl-ACP methyl ester carboxylesterase